MKHKHIHESYQIYGNFQYYYEQNDLAVARFTHLVELLFEHSYIPGTDYKTLFMTEFRNRIDKVAGNYIRIWQDIDDNKLEKLPPMLPGSSPFITPRINRSVRLGVLSDPLHNVHPSGIELREPDDIDINPSGIVASLDFLIMYTSL